MSVVSREQCRICEDSGHDNLVTHSDGSKHCYGCGYHKNQDSEEYTGGADMLSGEYRELKSRKISRKTCEFYDYEVGKYMGAERADFKSGSAVHIANYYDGQRNVVCQKLRGADKAITITGNGKGLDLYGKWLFTPNEKISITITEGELDALSVAQVFDCKYPVVSVPSGASSAHTYISKNLEWLSKFREVVLCFDMDEAGQAAAKKCADILPMGTVKLAKLSEKDASDMVTKGKTEELKNAIYRAELVSPDSIVSVGDITLKKPKRGVDWPWKTMTDLTYGIQTKAIYTVGAGSGIGKTEFVKDIVLHLAHKLNEKVGVIMLEQSPDQTLVRLIGGMLGTRLHVPGVDWDLKAINKAKKSLDGKVWLYDHYGSNQLDNVISKIRYYVKALGCKFIVLDHLTALAAEMKEERKGIDTAMARLGALVQEIDCTILLVSHLAKPYEGKSYEEGRKVYPASFRGSQSINYWSSFMIGLERNKLSEIEEERHVTTVRFLKDRFTGEADGCTMQLKYNRANGKLEELEEAVDFVPSAAEIFGKVL